MPQPRSHPIPDVPGLYLDPVTEAGAAPKTEVKTEVKTETIGGVVVDKSLQGKPAGPVTIDMSTKIKAPDGKEYTVTELTSFAETVNALKTLYSTGEQPDDALKAAARVAYKAAGWNAADIEKEINNAFGTAAPGDKKEDKPPERQTGALASATRSFIREKVEEHTERSMEDQYLKDLSKSMLDRGEPQDKVTAMLASIKDDIRTELRNRVGAKVQKEGEDNFDVAWIREEAPGARDKILGRFKQVIPNPRTIGRAPTASDPFAGFLPDKPVPAPEFIADKHVKDPASFKTSVDNYFLDRLLRAAQRTQEHDLAAVA